MATMMMQGPEPVGKGWHGSSWELRQGLEVTEDLGIECWLARAAAIAQDAPASAREEGAERLAP